MPSKLMKGWGALFVGLLLSAPAWGADQNSRPGVPGTLDYVEGKVSLDGQTLGPEAIGSTVIEAGQTLSTEAGKAEILLTPGIFLRVGSNSAARMISPGLANTQIELERGQAIVEVAEIHPENNIRIRQNALTVRLEKTGLYEFVVDGNHVRVFEGKAEVDTGTRQFTVKGEHELVTSDNGALKVEKFDRKLYADTDLYNWSSLRSAYLAEANVNEASYYQQYGWVPGGPPWWGAGWYWNPWYSAYTFMPGDGIFFSPFGWGFYSPWCVYRAPFYGNGYGYGHAVYYHHFSADAHNWGPGPHYTTGQTYAEGVYNGTGSMHGGFHSGGQMTGGGHGFGHIGGGFHGGGSHGGGFHGGGGFIGGHGGGAGGHGH